MASIINASTAGVGGVITTADNSGVLNLQTAGTTAVTVDASQNVGVGRTTSINSSKMSVETASATGAQQGIVLNNPYTFGSGVGAAASALTFTRMTGASYVPTGSIQGWNRSESTSNGGELAFSTQQTVAGGLVERMRIFYTGGVSIGNTTDPGASNLSVSGVVQADSNYADTGVASYGAGTSFTLTVSDTTEGAMYLISVSRHTTSTAATNRLSLLTYRSSGSFLTDIVANANVTISVSGTTITVTGVGTASLYGSVLGLT